jgi:uncharacterized protein YceH (UPF0502 family)
MDDNIDINDNSQEESSSNEAQATKAFLSAVEARVIGALMEKHLPTPNNYPLTVNSLSNACNQKSNRDPLMKLTEGQVRHTVNALVEL